MRSDLPLAGTVLAPCLRDLTSPTLEAGRQTHRWESRAPLTRTVARPVRGASISLSVCTDRYTAHTAHYTLHVTSDATAASDRSAALPLSEAEEGAWRSLVRALTVIPRVLDRELLATQGLSLAEYTTLMHLSEAPDRSMRMGELATSVSMTSGGLTRVIERLAHQGSVERVQAEGDKRGQIAVLTEVGMDRLRQAWPTHLAGVRRHVMDHLGGLDLVALADALRHVAETEVGLPVRRTFPPSAHSGLPADR